MSVVYERGAIVSGFGICGRETYGSAVSRVIRQRRMYRGAVPRAMS